MINPELFNTEKNLIESVLEPEEIITIHNSENSEIIVTVTPDEYIQSYVRPMLKIGYELQTEKSSIKKLVFLKQGSEVIQLSLLQQE